MCIDEFKHGVLLLVFTVPFIICVGKGPNQLAGVEDCRVVAGLRSRYKSVIRYFCGECIIQFFNCISLKSVRYISCL